MVFLPPDDVVNACRQLCDILTDIGQNCIPLVERQARIIFPYSKNISSASEGTLGQN